MSRMSLSAIQGELAVLGVRGRGFRYPLELQAEIGAYVREAREQGVSWRELSAQLQIGIPTLSRWQGALEARVEVPDAFYPVKLSPPAASPTYTLEAPNGFKLHGLDLNTALALLGRGL